MKSLTIKAKHRNEVGKKATKSLRKENCIPCVLYGGERPVHFSAPEGDFKNLVYTANAYTVIIELDTSESYNAILQDIQFHPVSDKILHVDFLQLFEDKLVIMDIPVKIVGVATGVINQGGVLRINRRKLRVKAFPKNLPDFLECNVTELNIGNKFYVTELKHSEYEILEPKNVAIAQVRTSRTAIKSSTEEVTTETSENS